MKKMDKRIILFIANFYMNKSWRINFDKICIYTSNNQFSYNNFNKKYCKMNEFACSLCSALCFKCTNYKETLKWVQLICQNCAINGNLKQHAKTTFNLIEQVVHQQVTNEKIRISNELNEYKRQFNRSESAVYLSLIKQETYKFAQDFVTFKENIIREDSSLQKTVKECEERILNLTENQTKRCIIEEVKGLNKGLQMEVDINRKNVEKVNQACKEARNKIANLLYESMRQGQNPREGMPIFTPEEINNMMSGFSKKINEMDRKAGALTKLCHQGDQMLTAEGSLIEAPRPRVEEKVLKLEEMKEDEQE